ncbi:MAG: DUF1549 domain-containing protein [Verrucomicrobiota bacterium]
MIRIAKIAVISALASPASLEAESERIDFAHQVVPILEKHCVECHGGGESKGGFSINTLNLFLDGEMAIPGNAAASYFVELMEDPDPEYRMPSDGKPPVPKEEIALLKEWVDQGMNWETGFTFAAPAYEPPLLPRTPQLPLPVANRTHPIDRLIDAYLQSNKLPQAKPLDDAAFLRRVSLDLVGLLPNPETTKNFLADKSPDKRSSLIDELLSRDINYTEHWLTFWNDLLRNDYDGTGFITGGRSQISGWLYEALRLNRPFDDMLKELIAPPTQASAGFINGIEWRGNVSAGQTLPIQFAQNVSQSFLGINMKCASCHDSFIDRWTLAEAYGLAAIYSEETLELSRCDKPTGQRAVASWPFPEIGNIDPEAPKEERLQQLADLIAHPQNGRTTRTIVNRLWAQLMGRGIVHPLDAMGTEPWNADLLDWLAEDFQKNGYDLKHTLRLIATSQAYQSQSVAKETYSDNGQLLYRGPTPKRLTAEQFVDVIWQFTDSAPLAFDAPVIRGNHAENIETSLSLKSSWIWAPTPNPKKIPANQAILARRQFSPQREVANALLIASVDKSYQLFLNGELLLDDGFSAINITPLLKDSQNEILILAQSHLIIERAAAIFCALRIDYANGQTETLMTDESWSIASQLPISGSPSSWELDMLHWDPAQVMVDEKRSKRTDSITGQKLASVSIGWKHPTRASLLKVDSLMRSLGRPNRDQIVTSRPNELTTLEAVDLSTSPQLFECLQKGAQRLLSKDFSNTYELIDQIYLGLLTRYPSKAEKRILHQTLGRKAEQDELTDILWTLSVSPEFFIIR